MQLVFINKLSKTQKLCNTDGLDHEDRVSYPYPGYPHDLIPGIVDDLSFFNYLSKFCLFLGNSSVSNFLKFFLQ